MWFLADCGVHDVCDICELRDDLKALETGLAVPLTCRPGSQPCYFLLRAVGLHMSQKLGYRIILSFPCTVLEEIPVCTKENTIFQGSFDLHWICALGFNCLTKNCNYFIIIKGVYPGI